MSPLTRLACRSTVVMAANQSQSSVSGMGGLSLSKAVCSLEPAGTNHAEILTLQPTVVTQQADYLSGEALDRQLLVTGSPCQVVKHPVNDSSH